jgi:hypothetical protein
MNAGEVMVTDTLPLLTMPLGICADGNLPCLEARGTSSRRSATRGWAKWMQAYPGEFPRGDGEEEVRSFLWWCGLNRSNQAGRPAEADRLP